MSGAFILPPDHQPAMRVPLPGSSCANCRYATIAGDGPRCANPYYQQWAGTSQLIDPVTRRRVMNPQEFCSDWFEPTGS